MKVGRRMAGSNQQAAISRPLVVFS